MDEDTREAFVKIATALVERISGSIAAAADGDPGEWVSLEEYAQTLTAMARAAWDMEMADDEAE